MSEDQHGGGSPTWSVDELERDHHADAEARARNVQQWLERDVWPKVPAGPALTKQEVEKLLGYDEMFPASSSTPRRWWRWPLMSRACRRSSTR